MIKYDAIFNFIEKVCIVICCAAVMLMMLDTTFDVFSRKFFDYSIPSLYQLNTEFLLMAMVWFSMSYVFVRGGHIRITMFVDKMPQKVRLITDKLMELGGLLFFVLLTYTGAVKAVTAFQMQETSASLLVYPMGPLYMMIPIGSALMAFRILQSIISRQSLEKYQEDEMIYE